MKLSFTLVGFLLTLNSLACQVQLPERIVVGGSAKNHCAFAATNCIAEDLQSLCELVQAQDGMVSIHRLQAAAGERVSLTSTVDQVRIHRISDLIRKKFPVSDGVDMVLAESSAIDFVGMNASSELELTCHPCLFNGDETLRLQVRQFSGESRGYSFKVKFTALVNAYRAKSTINAFSTALNAQQFEQVRVPQVSYGRYQTDLTKISFYKPNKTIRSGEILRESDLIPLTLVRAGDRVDLYFENDHVRLKSYATSRQNGGMGDKIEVWNQANGKKYRGVITDHNQVVVEL